MLGVTEVVVLGDGVSILVDAVEGLLAVDPLVALDQQLGAETGVDAVGDVLVVAVVDVAGAEAERGSARVDVVPVVVGVGDAEVALVLVAVAVGVADQRGLVVVVDEGVGDGDEVGGVGQLDGVSWLEWRDWSGVNVRQSDRRSSPCRGPCRRRRRRGRSRRCWPCLFSLVFFSSPRASWEIHTDGNGIAVVGQDLPDTQVTDDDVLLLLDDTVDQLASPSFAHYCGYVHSEALEHGVGVLSDDGGVGADLDRLGVLLDGAVDVDDLLVVALDGGGEGSERGDGGGSTAGTTGGAAVLAGVAEGNLSLSVDAGLRWTIRDSRRQQQRASRWR